MIPNKINEQLLFIRQSPQLYGEDLPFRNRVGKPVRGRLRDFKYEMSELNTWTRSYGKTVNLVAR